MNKFKNMLKGDLTIWGAVVLIAFIGAVEVYSCTSMISYKQLGGNTFIYPLKHVMYVFGGFVMMFLFSWFPYKKLARYADIAIIVSAVLLFLTLFTGESTNDAKRWFTIPILGLSFQPSDFAKITLMLFLAKMLALAQVEPETKWVCFLKCIGAIVCVCVFVFPANLSTAVLIAVACLFILVLGNFPRKWIGGLVVAGILLGLVVVMFLKIAGGHTRVDTWVSRIETFVSGDQSAGHKKDFQAEQARIAIGLGGLKGYGIGNGVQIHTLPHPYSDFIFASVAHEMGIIGVVGLLVGYIVLFYRFIHVVYISDRLFPALLVMGLSLNIILQTLANMLVAVGFFPVTGQPLPFVSMGGSSIISTGIAIGIILNVSRYAEKKEPVAEIEQNEEEVEEIVDYPFMVG